MQLSNFHLSSYQIGLQKTRPSFGVSNQFIIFLPYMYTVNRYPVAPYPNFRKHLNSQAVQNIHRGIKNSHPTTNRFICQYFRRQQRHIPASSPILQFHQTLHLRLIGTSSHSWVRGFQQGWQWVASCRVHARSTRLRNRSENHQPCLTHL